MDMEEAFIPPIAALEGAQVAASSSSSRRSSSGSVHNDHYSRYRHYYDDDDTLPSYVRPFRSNEKK